MNTILTDDERPKLPPAKNYLGDDASWGYDASDMEAYADAREAAVLAKLCEQKPVAEIEVKAAPAGGVTAMVWSVHLPVGIHSLYGAPLPAVVPEWMKPDPQCDEACIFQCTEGFSKFPKCASTSEAEKVCIQAYQVVGSLLADVGAFETDEAQKILDNLNECRVVHEVLPWPSFSVKPSMPAVVQVPRDLPSARDYAERRTMAVTADWMAGWDAARKYVNTAAALAPRASTMNRWTERWYGSGPDRGWSIWEMTTSTHGDRVAYVGEGEHSERLTTMIVQKHNESLAAPLPAVVQVPQGWKLVPAEPTPEMLASIELATATGLSAIYRAMLAAAPEAPAQGMVQADPCPGCKVGGVCRTPKCGRLKLPTDHPLRTGKTSAQAIPAPWREAVKVAREALQCNLAYGLQSCDDWVRDKADAALAQLDALEGGE